MKQNLILWFIFAAIVISYMKSMIFSYRGDWIQNKYETKFTFNF